MVAPTGDERRHMEACAGMSCAERRTLHYKAQVNTEKWLVAAGRFASSVE